MNKTDSIVATFLLLLLLNSCGTVADGLTGSKKKNNDEFLVEKKAPLVLPPNFGELPEPGTRIDNDAVSIEENSLSIEQIVSRNVSTSQSIENNEATSAIEKSIIEKINEK
mgnify:CR=1 FL=1